MKMQRKVMFSHPVASISIPSVRSVNDDTLPRMSTEPIAFIDARRDPQQRCLARAVMSHDGKASPFFSSKLTSSRARTMTVLLWLASLHPGG
jgi:hypothetical protein